MLHLPSRSGQNDRAYLMQIGESVMEMEFEHEAASDADRDAAIIKRLMEIEADGLGTDAGRTRRAGE